MFWLRVFIIGGTGASLVFGSKPTFLVTPHLPVSFLFDWDTPGQPFPVPVTAQCDTLNIKWSRSQQTGPNPVAPYYLHIYTSNFIQPFIIPAGEGLSFNYTVPFAPGTMYQICMFDKFGSSGGCQDKYTVIPANTPPTCANVTFAPQLAVKPEVEDGPMSQYGFLDQCSQISITPTNGTPPYTLTIAPTFQPPINITSYDMKPINWTVNLDWGSGFFVSLADSAGSLWSFGPMHTGGGGTIACLAGNVTSSGHHVKVPVAIGVSFLSLFLGVVIGGVALFMLSKRHMHRFVELGDSEPKSLRQRIVAAAMPEQAGVVPFQLSYTAEPMSYQGPERFPLPGPRMKGPGVNEDIERPPSYPQYTPAETDSISRQILERSLSTGTTTTVLATPGLSPASEKHYDPRGPLTFTRTRVSRSSDLP